MALTNPSDSLLPPAVPEYVLDVDTLHRQLGRADVYIAQLTTEMHRRAVETNQIHDALLAAQQRIAELQQQIDGGRDS